MLMGYGGTQMFALLVTINVSRVLIQQPTALLVQLMLIEFSLLDHATVWMVFTIMVIIPYVSLAAILAKLA